MSYLDDLNALADHNANGDGSDSGGESLAERIRGALLDTAGIRALPPPEPLIDSYLVKDSLAVLYGPSGAGKTFLTIDWAIHVADMPWWNGHDVHGGPVVYVIAEGASGVGRRIDAWTGHHVTNLGKHPIHWLPQAVNLTDLAEVYAFIEVATALDPVLIVFDTLARCIAGADENSARDMGLVVANLDRVRRATGACVLADHHSGKDTAAGARGSSALRAALDTEIELTATDDRLTLKVTKQKDGAEPKPMRLARIPQRESCVLVPAREVVDDGEVGPGPIATLETLREIQVPGGIAASVWEAAAAAGRSQFYAHRARLLNLGLVSNVGTDKQPRYLPAATEGDASDG